MLGEKSLRQRHLARNTAVVMASFALAALAGLGRNIVIAHVFGLSASLDAYYAAFKLPDLLFTVVAGGALATAFIPVFAQFLAEEDLTGAWQLASAITNLVVLAVSVLGLLSGLFAPWLVQTLIAPGFESTQQAETVTLMRLVLVSTLIFSISAVQGSILHGFKHFLLPALSPVLYPLGIMAGGLWLAPWWGIRGLAAGAVLGAVLHLGIKVPALLRYGFRWWPVLGLKTPAVRRVFILMGPRVLDLGVFHLTMLAATNLASRLGAGRVSALEWGWDAMQLPETIIGTAFGLVTFPTLAELAARGDRAGLRNTLGTALRAVLALTIPAALGLILLGRPLIQLLYQRGAFQAADTEAVFIALRFYALGLVGHACLELSARTFFAQGDTITPLLIASLFAALNIALGFVLMGLLDHGGLALANSLAVSGETLVLLLLLRRRLGHMEGQETLQELGRVLVATVLMGAVLSGVLALNQHLGASVLWTVVIGSTVGALSYFVFSRLLGVRELYIMLAALVQR